MNKLEDLADSIVSPASANTISAITVMPEVAVSTSSNQSQQTNSINSNSQLNNVSTVNSETATGLNTESLPPISELPSYYDALKLKKIEIELENGIPSSIPPSYYSSTHPNPNYLDETRITIDPADLRAITEASEANLSDQDVGSECMFLSAFMIAFFFNWVGFFASICLLPNAAGKYGALSGLGLSIAKWVTMIKVNAYNTWMTQMNEFQQKLFFWLFIFIGFYLFFKGLVNYMSIRYRPRAQNAYSQRIRQQWFGFEY